MKRLILTSIIILLLNGCRNSVNNQIKEDFTIDAQIIGRASICVDGPVDQIIVQIKVTNTSNQPKSFWIYKCSWEDSFRTDRDDIQLWHRECIGNFPIDLNIDPSKNITFTSSLKLLSDSIIDKPIYFRIGLIMLDENELKSKLINGLPNDKTIYWSTPIELDYFSINGYNKDDL